MQAFCPISYPSFPSTQSYTYTHTQGKIDTITSGGQAQYLLWSGGVDKTIRGWLARPEAGTFDQQVQFDCGFGVTKLEVVGDLLLSADTQGNVSVWHVPNKMRVQEFRAHEKAISGLLFAEGHLFTASLDKRLRVSHSFPSIYFPYYSLSPFVSMLETSSSPLFLFLFLYADLGILPRG